MTHVTDKIRGISQSEDYKFVVFFLFTHGYTDDLFMLSVQSPPRQSPLCCNGGHTFKDPECYWRNLRQEIVQPIQQEFKDKPKLYFVQKCRGDNVSVVQPTVTGSMPYSSDGQAAAGDHVVLDSDSFIGYSCVDGTLTNADSLFPNLTKEWQSYYLIEDLFTSVTAKVVHDHPYQVPESVSTLTKRLYVSSIQESQLTLSSSESRPS